MWCSPATPVVSAAPLPVPAPVPVPSPAAAATANAQAAATKAPPTATPVAAVSRLGSWRLRGRAWNPALQPLHASSMLFLAAHDSCVLRLGQPGIKYACTRAVPMPGWLRL